MGIYIQNMNAKSFDKLCKDKGLQLIYTAVPPHGDLIDRREVEKYSLPITECVDGEIAQNRIVYLQTIQNSPTVIPAEK